MKKFKQTAANLEAAIQSSLIRLKYSGEVGVTCYYYGVFTRENEDINLDCFISEPGKELNLKITLPVPCCEKAKPCLRRYIDRINLICAGKGHFEFNDCDVILVSKKISFSSFVISADSILAAIFSLKANAFDFADVLRCIGKDSKVPDDNGIASAIYYAMYPEKKY